MSSRAIADTLVGAGPTLSPTTEGHLTMSDSNKPTSFGDLMKALKESKGADPASLAAAFAVLRESYGGDARRDEWIGRQILAAVNAAIEGWSADVHFEIPTELSGPVATRLRSVLDAAFQRARERDIEHLKSYMVSALAGMAIALTGGDTPDFFSFEEGSTD